eukprot:Clim_evm25s242 gene=Clim_evmTU25s242
MARIVPEMPTIAVEGQVHLLKIDGEGVSQWAPMHEGIVSVKILEGFRVMATDKKGNVILNEMAAEGFDCSRPSRTFLSFQSCEESEVWGVNVKASDKNCNAFYNELMAMKETYSSDEHGLYVEAQASQRTSLERYNMSVDGLDAVGMQVGMKQQEALMSEAKKTGSDESLRRSPLKKAEEEIQAEEKEEKKSQQQAEQQAQQKTQQQAPPKTAKKPPTPAKPASLTGAAASAPAKAAEAESAEKVMLRVSLPGGQKTMLWATADQTVFECMRAVATKRGMKNLTAYTPSKKGVQLGYTIKLSEVENHSFNMSEKIPDSRQVEKTEADQGLGMRIRLANATKNESGIVAYNVNPTGPAGRAGVLDGDEILEINGESMVGMSSLSEVAKVLKASNKLDLKVQYSEFSEVKRGSLRSASVDVLSTTGSVVMTPAPASSPAAAPATAPAPAPAPAPAAGFSDPQDKLSMGNVIDHLICPPLPTDSETTELAESDLLHLMGPPQENAISEKYVPKFTPELTAMIGGGHQPTTSIGSNGSPLIGRRALSIVSNASVSSFQEQSSLSLKGSIYSGGSTQPGMPNDTMSLEGAISQLLTNVEQSNAVCKMFANRLLTGQGKRSMRQKVAHELLDTEKNYVHDLGELIARYLEPVHKEGLGVNNPALRQIWESAQSLLPKQKQFLDQLQGAFKLLADLEAQDEMEEQDECTPTASNENAEKVEEAEDSEEEETVENVARRRREAAFGAALAAAFVENAEAFKLYSEYCALYPAVENYLMTKKDMSKKENEEFQEFLEARNPKKEMSASLDSYLIKPVQRILKYPLLLRELIKYTEEDADDMQDLNMAEAVIKDVANEINEIKRRDDNREQAKALFESMEDYNGPRGADLGDLLYHCSVTRGLVDDKNRVDRSRGSTAECRYYLFTRGVLSCTKPSSEREASRFRDYMPIEKILIKDRPDENEETRHLIEMVNMEALQQMKEAKGTATSRSRSKATVILMCRNAEEKQRWITTVKNQIRQSILNKSSSPSQATSALGANGSQGSTFSINSNSSKPSTTSLHKPTRSKNKSFLSRG